MIISAGAWGQSSSRTAVNLLGRLSQQLHRRTALMMTTDPRRRGGTPSLQYTPLANESPRSTGKSLKHGRSTHSCWGSQRVADGRQSLVHRTKDSHPGSFLLARTLPVVAMRDVCHHRPQALVVANTRLINKSNLL